MKLRLAVLLFVSTLVPHAVDAAPITFSLTSPLLSGMPGDTLTFSATITDIGGSATYLNGTNSTSPFPVDDTLFFLNTPPVLAANQSLTAALFTVAVPLAISPGLYGGSFTILGGPTASDFAVLGTQNFQVNVTRVTAVPEPATGTLLLLGAGAASVVRRRRRRIQSEL